MEQSPWKVNSHLRSQEMPRLLQNTKFHYRVHKSPPLVPILHQMHPSTPSQCFPPRSVLILSSHLCVGLPSNLFLSGFPTKIFYVFLISPMRAAYPKNKGLWAVNVFSRKSYFLLRMWIYEGNGRCIGGGIYTVVNIITSHVGCVGNKASCTT
jgi:hypothetical protein